MVTAWKKKDLSRRKTEISIPIEGNSKAIEIGETVFAVVVELSSSFQTISSHARKVST